MAIFLLGLIAFGAPYMWPMVRATPPPPEELRRLYADGVVNVVEVADFECPHCRAFHPRLSDAIANLGREVHLVRIHYPLPGHPHARVAALVHICAARAGKGDEMASLLFTAEDLSRPAIVASAASIGLDVAALERCVDGPAARAELDEHRRITEALAVHGVPTTFIGDAILRGAQPSDEVESALRAAGSGEGAKGIPGHLYIGLVAVSVGLVVALARRRPEET
jgi:predicted DsbA family dithiol-disulfide isomerase